MSEPLILTLALNQSRKTATASTSPAKAANVSAVVHRAGLNHARMKAANLDRESPDDE